MSNESVPAKPALRQHLRAALRGLSMEERAQGSAQIRQRLSAQPVWQAAKSILFFAPTVTEPDLWPLLTEALAQGRRATLLRHSPVTNSYLPCVIHDPVRDVTPGQFGIPEPAAHCPIIELKQLDFALVPGIGFTLDGGRLGRGQGYYDRLLSGLPGFKCGVAFDCQLAALIPMEPHDVRLNCILTPTRWHPVPASVLK